MKILFLFGDHTKADAMKSLAASGHSVSFFNSGYYDLTRRPYLRWQTNGPIPGVDLVNSPNPHWTSGDPETQTEHPLVEQLTAQVLDRVQPDLVVVEDLSSHTLSVLELLQSRGFPTTVTIHNYWLLCPQNNLLDASGQQCDDFEEGARCCRCRWLPQPEARFRIDLIKTALRDNRLFSPIRRLRQTWRRVLAQNNTLTPGPPGWGPPRYTPSAFARRRQRAVAALNQVQEIHALSTRSAAVLTRHGISAEQIKVIPFLNSHFQQLAPAPRTPSARLTFGYRGDVSFTKGVHVIIQAFSQLDQTRARLSIYGSGEPDYWLSLRRLAQGLSIDFKGPYTPQDLPRINRQIDVGLVPSLCEETLCLAGLEFLYCGVPLITSRLGGMVDYVEEGVNGFLVTPGDPEVIAQAMRRFLKDPSLLTRLSANCRPRYSLDQVTDALEERYRKIISRSKRYEVKPE